MTRTFRSTLSFVKAASERGITTLDTPGKVAARVDLPCVDLPASLRPERVIDVGKGSLKLTIDEWCALFGETPPTVAPPMPISDAERSRRLEQRREKRREAARRWKAKQRAKTCSP